MLEPFWDFILATLEINSSIANQFNLGFCSSSCQNLGNNHQLVLIPTGIEHDFTAQFYLIRGDDGTHTTHFSFLQNLLFWSLNCGISLMMS
jgi:hypothetical protein